MVVVAEKLWLHYWMNEQQPEMGSINYTSRITLICHCGWHNFSSFNSRWKINDQWRRRKQRRMWAWAREFIKNLLQRGFVYFQCSCKTLCASAEFHAHCCLPFSSLSLHASSHLWPVCYVADSSERVSYVTYGWISHEGAKETGTVLFAFAQLNQHV